MIGEIGFRGEYSSKINTKVGPHLGKSKRKMLCDMVN